LEGIGGFLSSRRLLDLRCSGSDAPIVTPYRSPPRTPPARAGSFFAPIAVIADASSRPLEGG
jgi:hypothetical protein